MKKTVALVLSVLCLVLPMLGQAQEVVNVFNWEDYIDESVLEQFEKETGIHVNYMRFTTNEDMMVQVEADPSAFDVVFPSEYCVERMMNKGLLAEINYDNVPNFSNTLESLRNPSYDPNNAHSVPYLWGTLGILYNTTMVDEPIDSWSCLFDGKYAGSIFMLDSIRDTMGLALRYLGYSMNSTDYNQLREAADLLIAQKKSGAVKAYQVDETKDKMVAGEAAVAVMWSGDAQYAIELNEDLAYVLPKEGTNVWVDCAVIPVAARNKENAEKFIDFLCRADIAEKICYEIWYSTPNAGAIERMAEDYTDNYVMNPDPTYLETNSEYFNDLDAAWLTVYNTLWQEVKNTK